MIARMKALLAMDTLPAALLLSGMFAFYLPLSMAVDNRLFFVFSPFQFAGVLAVVWIASAAALAAVGQMLPEKGRAVWGALLVAVAVSFWAQAWFMTADLKELHWWYPLRPHTSFFSSDTLLTGGILTAAGFAFVRFRADVVRFLWLLNFGAIIYTAYLIATDPTESYRARPTEELSRFSASRNVIVVVLDAFQSDVFSEIVAEDSRLGAEFEGFTFFADATGIAASTHLAMPTIHSGKVYQNGTSIKEFYASAVKEESFMARLAGAEYVGVYLNPTFKACPAGLAWCGHEATLTSGNFRAYVRELSLLMGLSFRRVLPGLVRDMLYRDQSFDPDVHQRVEKGIEVLRNIAQGMTVVQDGAPRVKFLHLMSTHAPVRLDENCEPFKGKYWIRDDMRRQATCAVKRVGEFLRALKRNRVYDQSLIVLLADHGSGFSPAANQPKTAGDPEFHMVSGMSAVLLLVKPEQARGPMQTSERAVDLRDVATTICAATGACRNENGESLLGGNPSRGTRERQFMYYDWRFGQWTKDRLKITRIYRIAGPRTDPASWRVENQKN